MHPAGLRHRLQATPLRPRSFRSKEAHVVGSLLQPLNWIFWGALICVFDLYISQTSGGYGMRFDLINDVIGTILIACGTARLRTAPVSAGYATAMTFVHAVALFAIGDAVFDHFITPPDTLQHILGDLFNAVAAVGLVVFALAMRWLCESVGLLRSATSWRTTFWLLVVLHAIPVVAGEVIGWMRILLSLPPLKTNFAPLALVLIITLCIPLLHLLLSLWRTMRETQEFAQTSAPPEQLA
jgi:hypothetical protein